MPSGLVAVAVIVCPQRSGRGQHDIKTGVARRIGRNRGRTQVVLAFAKSGRIGCGIGIEVQCEGRARQAVQRAGDPGGSSRLRGGQLRKVLQAVDTRVGIHGVVQSDSAATKIDPQTSVFEKRVCAKDISSPSTDRPWDETDAVRAIGDRNLLEDVVEALQQHSGPRSSSPCVGEIE